MKFLAEPVLGARRRRAAPRDRDVRHLRPRQRRRGSARRCSRRRSRSRRRGRQTATTSSASSPTTSRATSRARSTPPRGSPGPATGCRSMAVDHLDRARRHEHGDRGRPRDDEPRARAAPVRPTSSPPASPTPSSSSSRTRAPFASASTTPSARSRASSTGSTARAAHPLADMNAMRVLTDPADTGAVTVCLPAGRPGRGVRLAAGLLRPAGLARRTARARARSPRPGRRGHPPRRERPLVVAGGGVVYSEASEELARSSRPRHGSRCPTPMPARGRINWDHPLGRRRTSASHRVGRGQRPSRTTRTSSSGSGPGTRTSRRRATPPSPATGVRFVNVNVLGFDAAKHGATDARRPTPARRSRALDPAAREGWSVDDAHRQRAIDLDADWQRVVDECYHRDHTPLPAQTEVFGALNELMGPEDVVEDAAGSMPGDLQCLWRASTPVQYHVEYAFSCMGYEIPAALGVKLALGDDHEVVAIVGDGTYQMLPMEIATIVSEGVKVIIVLSRQPRVRLDRRAVGVARVAAVRDEVPDARRGDRPPRRRERCRSTSRPTPRRGGPTSCAAPRSPEFRENYARDRGLGPHDGPAHRDRPHSAPTRPGRRGGTSPSPRSRRSPRPGRRTPSTSRPRRPQRALPLSALVS